MTCDYIIISYITMIIVALYIIAIGVAIDAYADYKYYKLTKLQHDEQLMEKTIVDYMNSID